MDFDGILCHKEALFRAALYKTQDADKAEDLVQETYLYTLTAISKGRKIDNMKAYMFSVLNNRLFMSLREKYRMNVVYYDELPDDFSYEETGYGAVIESDEAEIIRREISFLAKTYRDVMVLYYMQNQSVAQIAQSLSIPKGTVLSRLDAGRDKIKKGVETLETYNSNSYQPERLVLAINGRSGQNNEPFNCIGNLINQNILITAYDKPLTVLEIAKALGVPMAFIEESVEQLVFAELLKRIGTKVATDFYIRSPEYRYKAHEICKRFAKETFDTVNSVFMNMLEQYRNIAGFSAFNQTQQYIHASLSAYLGYFVQFQNEISESKQLDFSDYPDRPNYGKWIAVGQRYPTKRSSTDEFERYAVSGRSGIHNINEFVESSIEWDTAVGRTHNAVLKYSLSQQARALVIDAVRTDTVNAFQAELMPDLEKLGFVKQIDGKKAPSIPYLTKQDAKSVFEIEETAGKAVFDACFDKAAKICHDNPVTYPGHISYLPNSEYTELLIDLPMAYVYEAAERGIITIEPDRNYPVMYFIMR